MKTVQLTSSLFGLLITASVSYGALITNGNLETAVTASAPTSGSAAYTLDEVSGNVTNAAQGTISVENAWALTSLTKGYTYSATGGNGGGGGFVSTASSQNKKARGVGFWANDGGATTGLQTVGIDTLLVDNAGDGTLFINLELYAWNSGTAGVSLSMGGGTADVATYNVTDLGGATTILVDTVDVADATGGWDTTTFGVDLGTGYDYYAWRIGVVGAAATDTFSVDNLTVTAVPEPATLGLMASIGAGLLFIRRRLML